MGIMFQQAAQAFQLIKTYLLGLLFIKNAISHSKGQITVGFCSCVAYFNQLSFAS
jgi:hypothetical protein